MTLFQTLFQSGPRRYFDRWAEGYDRDLEEAGYTAPALAAAAIADALRAVIAAGPPGLRPRVLDIGIGTGLGSAALRALVPQVYIHGTDFSAAMLARAGAKRVADTLSQTDAQTGKLPGGPFDAMLALGLIEFIRDPAPLLTGMAASLSPGGVAALTFETPDGAKLYRPGVLSGIVGGVPGRVDVRRLHLRLPWPDAYTKHLHAPDAVAAMAAQAGLRVETAHDFIAYHRAGEGDVPHCLMVLGKPPA